MEMQEGAVLFRSGSAVPLPRALTAGRGTGTFRVPHDRLTPFLVATSARCTTTQPDPRAGFARKAAPSQGDASLSSTRRLEPAAHAAMWSADDSTWMTRSFA